MVTRFHGAPRQGVWFSKDVAFVQLTATGALFLTDLTLQTYVDVNNPRQADAPNSSLEQVLELLATRGTVIGLTVETDEIITVIVDYGQAIVPLAGTALGGQTAQNIEAELEAAIIAIDAPTDITAAALVVSTGFGIATPGTPA